MSKGLNGKLFTNKTTRTHEIKLTPEVFLSSLYDYYKYESEVGRTCLCFYYNKDNGYSLSGIKMSTAVKYLIQNSLNEKFSIIVFQYSTNGKNVSIPILTSIDYANNQLMLNEYINLLFGESINEGNRFNNLSEFFNSNRLKNLYIINSEDILMQVIPNIYEEELPFGMLRMDKNRNPIVVDVNWNQVDFNNKYECDSTFITDINRAINVNLKVHEKEERKELFNLETLHYFFGEKKNKKLLKDVTVNQRSKVRQKQLLIGSVVLPKLGTTIVRVKKSKAPVPTDIISKKGIPYFSKLVDNISRAKQLGEIDSKGLMFLDLTNFVGKLNVQNAMVKSNEYKNAYKKVIKRFTYQDGILVPSNQDIFSIVVDYNTDELNNSRIYAFTFINLRNASDSNPFSTYHNNLLNLTKLDTQDIRDLINEAYTGYSKAFSSFRQRYESKYQRYYSINPGNRVLSSSNENYTVITHSSNPVERNKSPVKSSNIILNPNYESEGEGEGEEQNLSSRNSPRNSPRELTPPKRNPSKRNPSKTISPRKQTSSKRNPSKTISPVERNRSEEENRSGEENVTNPEDIEI